MLSNLLVSVLNTLTTTPWWVWAILCYVIFIGIKSTRDRIVYLPKLFILPVISLGLKYEIFTSGDGGLLIVYFSCMLLSFVAGFFLGLKAKVQILRTIKSVKLLGSYRMVGLLSSYFCIKYALGFLQATDPGLAFRYMALDTAITALLSGYLLGKAVAYTWLLYRGHKT